MDYEKILHSYRSQYSLLTDITFVLPQETSTQKSFPVDELSILSGSREFLDSTFEESFFSVPGTVLDFASDQLRFEDRVIGMDFGQFESDIYSIHIGKSLCLINVGDFYGKFCYNLTNKIIFDGEEYKIVAKKVNKLLNQVRLVVRRVT